MVDVVVACRAGIVPYRACFDERACAVQDGMDCVLKPVCAGVCAESVWRVMAAAV